MKINIELPKAWMDNLSIYVNLTLQSLFALFTFCVKLLHMFCYFISVMVTLGCQFDGLWDQLGDILLVGSLMTFFSRKVNWGGRTSLSKDNTFHLQPRSKRSKGKPGNFPLTTLTPYWGAHQLCLLLPLLLPSFSEIWIQLPWPSNLHWRPVVL